MKFNLIIFLCWYFVEYSKKKLEDIPNICDYVYVYVCMDVCVAIYYIELSINRNSK